MHSSYRQNGEPNSGSSAPQYRGEGGFSSSFDSSYLPRQVRYETSGGDGGGSSTYSALSSSQGYGGGQSLQSPNPVRYPPSSHVQATITPNHGAERYQSRTDPRDPRFSPQVTSSVDPMRSSQSDSARFEGNYVYSADSASTSTRSSFQAPSLRDSASVLPDYGYGSPQPVSTRASFNERTDSTAPSALSASATQLSAPSSSGISISSTQGREEEVQKLRKMLSSASAELGRQLTGFKPSSNANDSSRVEWLQKLVLQMETKQTLLESELNDQKMSTNKYRERLDETEQQNNMLREQHARHLRESSRASGASSSQGLDDSRIRQLTQERDGFKAQFEELNNRHAILQRSLRLMDEQKQAEQGSSVELGRKLKDAEGRGQTLENQKSLLNTENQMLKEQLQSERMRYETLRNEMKRQGDGLMDSHRQEINRALGEISELNQMLEQSRKDRERDVQELMERFEGNKKDLMLRLHQVESNERVSSKKAEEMEKNAAWLSGKLQMTEEHVSTYQSLSQDRDLQLDRASFLVSRKRIQGRVFCPWRDFIVERNVRLQNLHGLLKSIEKLWNRRFYKNNFLAWKFVWGKSVSASEEVRATYRRKLVKGVMEDWLHAARSAEKQKSDTRIVVECETKQKQAEAAIEAQNAKTNKEMIDKMSDEHSKQILTLQKASDAKEMGLQSKIQELLDRHAGEVKELNKNFDEMQARLHSEMSNLKKAHAQDIESLKAGFKAQQDEKAAQVQQQKDEMMENQIAEINNLKEAHSAAVEELKKTALQKEAEFKLKAEEQAAQAKELEEQLRSQIVEENNKWHKELQELRDEHAKQQREARKKQLDREKEHSSQLEEAERKRIDAEEEEHRRIRQKEAEHEAALSAIKAEGYKALEELRQKMYTREKEFSSKLEAARAENIQAQEEWEAEAHKKDDEYKAKLEAKDQEFKHHLDNLLSNRVSVAIKDLESQVTEKEAQLTELKQREQDLMRDLERDLSKNRAVSQDLEDARASNEQLQHEAVDLQEQRNNLQRRLDETTALLQESQNIQGNLVSQVEKAESDLESLRKRDARAEETYQQLEKELQAVTQEKEQLSSELNAASQSLLKRGDDFSESVRLLQGRLESSDHEIKDLQAQLKAANSNNARLSGELQEASALLLKYSSNSTNQESMVVLQQKLERAEAELLRQEEALRAQLDEERNAARRVQTDLQESLGVAQQRIEALESNLSDSMRGSGVFDSNRNSGDVQSHRSSFNMSEDNVFSEQLQRRLEAVERENETLTNEMDNILVENANLRGELDEAQDLLEQRGVYPQPSHDASFATPRKKANNIAQHKFAFHLGVMQGLAKAGQLREVFGRWFAAMVEKRMHGTRAEFSSLDPFTSPEGCVADWFPVDKLRKTEIEVKSEKIGSGTFAEVYRGSMKLPCAVKLLKGPMQQKEVLEFVREGEMMRGLSHPNLVKLLGIYSEAGSYSLVLEYVQGCNLFDYLHKFNRTIPIGKQLGIAVQLCDAMVYIHGQGIVHRDLKPQNVIYQEKSGNIKLCDFGLARLLPIGVDQLHPSQLGTGGTPAYQGPEVLKRQAVGKKLDQYGFAVTLWEMYTTKLPWSDCNLEQMTKKVAVQNDRPPIPHDMPRDYSQIISRSWHRDPNFRPHFWELMPSLTDMHASLNPGSKLSSASSVSSMGSGSSASTVVSNRAGAMANISNSSSSAIAGLQRQGSKGKMNTTSLGTQGRAPYQPKSGGALYGPF